MYALKNRPSTYSPEEGEEEVSGCKATIPRMDKS
jgi:hypothetical protein